ncbi:MAG: acyltransferase family protein, partial [Rhizobiaceae bacterium]
SRSILVSQNGLRIYGPFLKWLNRYSTSIFLFHFPILFFIVAITPYDRTNPFHQIGLLIATLALSCVLGRICFYFKPHFDRWQKQVITALDTRFPRPDGLKTSTTPLTITQSHSEFLTLAKLVATLCVVLGHYSFDTFTSFYIPGFNGTAPRFAVPMFFMVSGYFLMMSIDRSRSGFMGVTAKRAFSLYYIVIPMLVVTLILDNIGYRANAVVYEFTDYYILEHPRRPYTPIEIIIVFLSSITYMNESWIFNLLGVYPELGGMRAFSNDPFWFMCYLIPFSAILAVIRLTRPMQAISILIPFCLIIGPPVLMLAPLFFSGSVAYSIHKKWSKADENHGPEGS